MMPSTHQWHYISKRVSRERKPPFEDLLLIFNRLLCVTGRDMECVHRHPTQECAEPAGVYGCGTDRARAAQTDSSGDHRCR